MGAVAVGALTAARPVLDAAVARTERRMNPVGPGPLAPPSERAMALHATLRVADLHADSLLWGRDLLRRGDRGQVDVPRLIEGNVAVQVFSMPVKTPRHLNIERNEPTSDDVTLIALAKRWPPATWRSFLARVLHLAANARRFEAGSEGAFRLLGSRADLAAYLSDRAANPAMTAGILSIEGAHALDDDPANVEVAADAGIRMISPAHFFDTAFGGSAHGMEQYGLTDRGREMVRRMEARGVILDVAHSSARTLTDAHLAGIAATGGLVGIGFWETACGGPDPSWIARSIAHAVERIGVAHVALGSDWDGAVGVPFDAAGLVHLTDALLDVGLDEAAIRAVMGENVLRVLGEALP